MEGLFDSGISLILYLQGLGNWLTPPMRFFSFLGDEEFFLLIMPAFYWCVSAAIGFRLGLLLLFSSTLNSVVKLMLQGPRPYWYSTQVRAMVTETSFGAPSGHAQNAVAVWGGLAYLYRRGWLWIAAIATITLIGLSRIYVGVHFPVDVASGWLAGALILLAFIFLEAPVKAWISQRSLGTKLVTAFSVSLILILLGAAARMSLGAWTVPTAWIQNATVAAPEADSINPLAMAGIVGNAGALFGLIAGVILLPLFGGFHAGGVFWRRGLRFIIGVIGVIMIWRGLGAVLPGGEIMVAYIFRYLRYFLIGAWIAFLAPLLFIRLGLATGSAPGEAEQEARMRGTMLLPK